MKKDKKTSKMLWYINRQMGFLCLFVCLSSCAPVSPTKIVSPKIISSVSPPNLRAILSINHVNTLGQRGQGAGDFLNPHGLALDIGELLYVADAGNHRIQIIDFSGDFIAEIGHRGWQSGEFDNPMGLAISFVRSSMLYVADTGNDRIQFCSFIDRAFQAITDSLVAFDRPYSIVVDRNGEILVVDRGNHRFVKFSSRGEKLFERGSYGSGRDQLQNPTDIALDQKRNIYVVDSGNQRLKKYDFSGNLIFIWSGNLHEPSHVALDRSGYVYITDRRSHNVKVLQNQDIEENNNQLVFAFGQQQLVDPTGIAISKNGKIFVSDSGANDIKVFQTVYTKQAISN
ncbi:MAG: NHL repeat-containing protein [Candidatus Poribacteria bacterium]|nr:NHL repeat-containing protein [Candidatus Poribacteria bacterium]